MFGLLSLAPLLAVLPAHHAQAQVVDRYFPANIPAYQDWFATTAAPTSGQGYEPLGVREGAFIIRPNITEGFGYDSNPTGTANGPGSAEVDSSARVSINSDWARNAISAAASVDDQRYLEHANDSHTDWSGSLGATVDYDENVWQFGYSHLETTSLPTDIGTFGLSAPITTRVDDARASATFGTGRFTLVPEVIGQLYNFSTQNTSDTLAQPTLSNRNEITGRVTAGYEFAGGHNAIVILSDTGADYSNTTPAFNLSSYNEASVLAGIEYRASAIFAYRVLGGYQQRFDTGSNGSSGSISAPLAELDLLYSPTRLTTITAEFSRSLQDEPSALAQGVTSNELQFTVKHDYSNNLVLQANAGYGRAEYPTGNEVQSTYNFGANATLSLNRNWTVALRYNFTKADDTTNALERFTRNQVLLQLGFRL